MGTCVLLAEMQNAVATAEDIMAVPQKFKTKIWKIKNKIKNAIALWIMNWFSTSEYTPKEMKSRVSNRCLYTKAALFTIVKRWKQPKNTPRDEQKNKMWHIQWNIIQSLKRHEALTHMNEPWKYYAKWKKRQTQKATHIWFQFYEMSRISKSMVERRRPNQSIRKETNPQYSLEELMLKLKLQYFGQLI